MPQIIRITSKRPGFRRAGINHPAEPVEYPAERFTDEQIERLKREPMLVVDVIDDDAGDPNKDDGATVVPPQAGTADFVLAEKTTETEVGRTVSAEPEAGDTQAPTRAAAKKAAAKKTAAK